MHLALFFLINLAVAAGIGAMAYLQGFGGWGIALRVLGALVILQAVYALWVLAVSALSRRRDDAKAAPRDGSGLGRPVQKKAPHSVQ
jgi:hypothetical protein